MAGLFGLAASLLLVVDWTARPDAPPPVPIVNGSDAEVCDYPAAIAVLNDEGNEFCTAALVHPRIIMLAAHCVEGASYPTTIAFGETTQAPDITVPVADCVVHPEYIPGGSQEINPWDLAYCELTEDAPDVPIVPPLMGCEADELVPDANIMLVGFGLDNEEASTGNNRKRWVVNTVEVVNETDNDLVLLGADGASVCFGDSGGPAYMQLPDGTWRLVGITSEPHPDVFGEDLVCGYGAIYDLVHLEMAWFEEDSGYDLTPCFDADGTWNPDEDCGGFATALDDGDSWNEACATSSMSGPSATCGEPFAPPGGTSTGGETDTDDSSTGAPPAGTGMAESSTGPDDDTTTGDPPPTSVPGTDAGTSGASDTDGNPSADGDSGCGCRHTRSNGTPVLILLALPALRRRRRAARP